MNNHSDTRHIPAQSGADGNDEMLGQLLEALGEPKEKPRKPIDPLTYLALLSQRRWYFLIPVLAVALVGLVVALKLPKVYEATTLILVRPQTVPSDYVRPVVTDDLENRISSISQQINSRTNLEEIMAKYDLFDGEAKEMFTEDKLTNLRERITVDLHRKDRREDPNSFSVTFRGRNPQTVMDVANTLANNFINENLKLREAQVYQTNTFIEKQLESTRERLQQLEQELQHYRSQYMGGLPEQLDTNLQMLERIEQQQSDKQAAIRDAKNRLLMINQQLTELRGMVPAATSTSAAGADRPMDKATRLALLKQELSALQDKYTERHPDVIRLNGKVASLEAEIASEGGAGATPAETAGIGSAPPFFVQQMTSLVAQRAEAQQEIESLAQALPKLQDEVQRLQDVIEKTPKREQELLGLRRDYNNLTESYNSLLARKQEAEIALNLERNQSGEQFRIIDRAQLPTKPMKPDMRKLLIVVLGLALAAGAGLVFAVEYLDTSFKSMDDAVERLGLPLLASFPLLAEKRSRGKLVFNNVMAIASIAVVIGLFGILAAMSIKGVDPAVQMLKGLL